MQIGLVWGPAGRAFVHGAEPATVKSGITGKNYPGEALDRLHQHALEQFDSDGAGPVSKERKKKALLGDGPVIERTRTHG